MSKVLRTYFVALAALVALDACWSKGGSQLRAAELTAGAATVDLTPPLEVGAPLGGYGERMSRPAEGVHDRILAKALVLSDGSRKFALVTADLLGFPPAVKSELVHRLAGEGWRADQLLLLPSHSHTSVDMGAINPANTFNIPQIGIYNPRAFEFVMQQLVQVVRDAERQLAPVAVGTSSVAIDGWNRNRRGGAVVDDELTVTRVDAAGGKPLAVLVNFTAHPTFMSGEDMQFSGDWPGHVQRTLESLIGGGVTAMYFNGAQGDQSPVDRPGAGPSRWERAERYGRDLGVVAWKQWQQTATHADVAFAFHEHAITLPAHAAHPEIMKTGGAEYGLSDELLGKLLPVMCPAEVKSVSFRLGDLLIVGVPGEMAASLGLQVKSEARRITGAAHPAIGGLADVWVSYILPADEYRRGGYEASMSFYGDALGETIRSGVLAGVEELQRGHAGAAPAASRP